jgi:hypothetical protein
MCAVIEGRNVQERGIDIYYFFMKKPGHASYWAPRGRERRVRSVGRPDEGISDIKI